MQLKLWLINGQTVTVDAPMTRTEITEVLQTPNGILSLDLNDTTHLFPTRHIVRAEIREDPKA